MGFCFSARGSMKLEIDVAHLLSHGRATGISRRRSPIFRVATSSRSSRACKIRGELLMRGISCYSPIAETYMVAMICRLPHADHDLWMADDLPKLEGACG